MSLPDNRDGGLQLVGCAYGVDIPEKEKQYYSYPKKGHATQTGMQFKT